MYFIFAWAASMLKFCKTPTGPCGAPTYLPTYLPFLWETKKEITGRVKVVYIPTKSDGWWYSPATTVLLVTWQATLKPYKHQITHLGRVDIVISSENFFCSPFAPFPLPCSVL